MVLSYCEMALLSLGQYELVYQMKSLVSGLEIELVHQ